MVVVVVVEEAVQSWSTGSLHQETGTVELLFSPVEDDDLEPGIAVLHHPVVAIDVVAVGVAVDVVVADAVVADVAVVLGRQSPAQAETVYPSREVEQQSENC